MGLFGNQFSNVVEWEEFRDDLLFWKWNNNEIKKGSKLIIRQGQDAIFMFNGKIEGIFTDEGSFDIESEIVPFLSTLKGFKFGFNSGMRAEVLFINTKEILVKWGTKGSINIPAPGLPGGMPIRSFGTFTCKVDDETILIEKIAGIRQMFSINDVKERVLSFLDQLLMKWIAKEGKDMFDLQANAIDISKGLCEDLDMEMRKIGIAITSFAISSFSYPEEVQKMVNKVASHNMVGDMNRYSQVSMVDAMSKGNNGGRSVASDMAGMQMGMMMGQQVVNQMNQPQTVQNQPQAEQMNQSQSEQMNQSQSDGKVPNFCPNCGTKTNGANFCPHCGNKLV